ncbi:MAG TPA: ATP-binding cassette domain-containing protein [Candidatus Dojkabacteria bacterium]|nr:ATP-binding cassette domain-containing protein [Candidatus Dojkabacteria bacterium]
MIEFNNITKQFDKTKVLKGLTFTVEKGDIYAFLGPNGSGKTTAIRILLGLLSADSGTALIQGKQYSYNMSDKIGYLPEERGLYLDSRVLETMVYIGQMKGMKYFDAKESAEKYLERVGLADKAQLEIKKLSSGQQQKIQLGITVINRPQIVILDEPTKGLDPLNQDLMINYIKELNDAGSTILFSTHQMVEAEEIAQKILIIKDGKVGVEGKIDEVKRNYKGKSLHDIFITIQNSNESEK